MSFKTDKHFGQSEPESNKFLLFLPTLTLHHDPLFFSFSDGLERNKDNKNIVQRNNCILL